MFDKIRALFGCLFFMTALGLAVYSIDFVFYVVTEPSLPAPPAPASPPTQNTRNPPPAPGRPASNSRRDITSSARTYKPKID